MRKVIVVLLTIIMIIQSVFLCSCSKRSYVDLYAAEMIKYIESKLDNNVKCVYSEYSDNSKTVEMKFYNVDNLIEANLVVYYFNDFLKNNDYYALNSDKRVSIELYSGSSNVTYALLAKCASTETQYIDYLDLYSPDKAHSYKFSQLKKLFPSIRYLCLGNKYYADDIEVFADMRNLETIVIDSGYDIDSFDLRDMLKERYPNLNLYC